MNKLKFILPLILATITLVTYRPIEAQANTSNYTITFTDNTFLSNTGSISSSTNASLTNKIEITNNFIILSQKVSYIHFWNNNNYLGHYTDTAGTVQAHIDYWSNNLLGTISITPTIPNNATHFQLQNDKRTEIPNTLTFSQFQSLTVSYDNPAPPLPSETPTTFPNISFINNELIRVDTGLPEANSNAHRTDLIDVSNAPNLFTLTGLKYTELGTSQSQDTLIWSKVFFYDNDMEFIGWQHNFQNSTDVTNSFRLPLNNRHPDRADGNDRFPTGTRYIALQGYNQSDSTLQIRNENAGLTFSNTQFATFAQFSTLEYVTNLRLVKWGREFDDGSKVFFAEQFVEVGTDLSVLSSQLTTDPNLVREGFEFTGYDGITTVPTTNGPFEKLATYNQLVTYEVTFLDHNGALIGTVTVNEGDTATPPFIPSRTGYTFDSWLPPVANIFGNLTTTAQYTPNLFTITWLSDNDIVKQTQEPYDSQILDIIPEVTKAGHVLVGWIYAIDSSPVTSGLVEFSFTAEAVWQEATTYTVTWRDVDFSTLKIEYVIESGLATPPVYIASSGFQLVGWSPDPTQPITANTIFIAQVEPISTTTPPTAGNGNVTGLTDLFAGVFGAIVGSLMILGTIDLFGLQLSSLFWLFFAGTGFMMMWRLLRG